MWSAQSGCLGLLACNDQRQHGEIDRRHAAWVAQDDARLLGEGALELAFAILVCLLAPSVPKRPLADDALDRPAGALGLPELGTGEVGTVEAAVDEGRLPEIGITKDGAGEVGAGEVGVVQVGAKEVGNGEIGAAKVSAGEVGTGELGVGESETDNPVLSTSWVPGLGAPHQDYELHLVGYARRSGLTNAERRRRSAPFIPGRDLITGEGKPGPAAATHDGTTALSAHTVAMPP